MKSDNEYLIMYKVFVSKCDWNKALSCLFYIYGEDREFGYNEIVKFRKLIISKDIKELDSILKQSYKITAKDYFKDFMTFVEWNRPYEQRFWFPRSQKLSLVVEALQDLEDDKLDELFLSLPPRIGKTSIVQFFVLWVSLKNSEKSNLYASYTESVVKAFYNGIMEILNDNITYLWQEVFPNSKVASTDAKDLLLNIDRKKKYATFTARSLYGTLNGACDCNGYLIGDDLISGIEEAMSHDRLDNAWLKVDNNLIPRAKEKAKKIWIGTRWATTDPQARRKFLLENEGKYKGVRWKDITIPALNEEDKSNFEYRFNVGFTTEYYQMRRTSFENNNDMASWLAQYQGTPIERQGAVFEPDSLRFFNGILPDNDPDRIFMAVDPAWGGGDYTSSPICFQYGDDIYVPDVVYNNGDKKITQPLLANKVMNWGVQAMTIEATKATQSYAEGVDEILKQNSCRINLTTSTKSFQGNGKENRIFDKAPDIREHFIFLESGKRSKEYEAFMNNLYSFKIVGKNKNDDAPDSLAMAVDMAFFKRENTIRLSFRPF